MTINQSKKPVEPFNLVGENSLIYSKEEAKKILKDNSYYIFVAAFMMLVIFILLSFKPVDIGISKATILIFGVFYFILGVCRTFMSCHYPNWQNIVS